MSLDLFTPVVAENRFHPAFAKVYTGGKECDREVLRDWCEGFEDRDGKFIIEFQTTFDSSFWELYLHAAFKDLGLRCDFDWPRPDFCVAEPLSFSVEATIALNAQGTLGVEETDPLSFPKDFNEFNRQAIIRLSNSLHKKHRMYVESYSTLDHVKNKPFVIAITAFDRPHFYLQASRAMEALLYRSYCDEEAYLKKHPNREVPLKPADLPFVHKDSGATLPLGLFCDDKMAGISAIIQTTSATWSKVRAMSRDPDVMIEAVYENRVEGGISVFRGPNVNYNETILDGLRIYHNPFADFPLGVEVFDRREVFQATSTGPVRMVLLRHGKRHLVNRRAITFQPGAVEKAFENAPGDQNFWWSSQYGGFDVT